MSGWGERGVSAETAAAVLALLVREADLDGLATVRVSEIVKETGYSQSTVNRALITLRDDGKIVTLAPGKPRGWGETGGGTPPFAQLSDKALDSQ